MKPGFSEFSYGYAVTEDIVHSKGPLRAAPSFPSLRSEGTGGFDVKLCLPGLPLFLQFKLSDCMIGPTANEAQQGLLMTPFFRMHIRPQKRSCQHKLLLALEATGKAVYYVAPAFHQEQEFNVAYTSRSILTKSVMISPAAIGQLPDDEDHHISFKNVHQGFGYLLSESAHKVEIHSWEDVIGTMGQHWTCAKEPLQELLPKMEIQMLDIITTHFEEALHSESAPEFRAGVQYRSVDEAQEVSRKELIQDFMADEDPISRVASLSQAFFNCTLLIVQHNS